MLFIFKLNPNKMHPWINLPTKGVSVPTINLMIQPKFLLNQFFDNINY